MKTISKKLRNILFVVLFIALLLALYIGPFTKHTIFEYCEITEYSYSVPNEIRVFFVNVRTPNNRDVRKFKSGAEAVNYYLMKGWTLNQVTFLSNNKEYFPIMAKYVLKRKVAD